MLQALAVFPMIVKPAGFLTGEQRRHKANTVFLQLHPFRDVSGHDLHVLRQTFHGAKRALVAQQDTRRRKHFIQRLNHLIPPAVHRRRGQLYRQIIAKPIDNQTGQKVGITKDRPIKGLIETLFTQLHGLP